MDESTGTKTCSKCGVEKPLGEFSRHARCEDGRESRCKLCAKKYHATWHAAHMDEQKAYKAGYRDEHRDEIRAYNAKYRAEHPDRVKTSNADWRQTRYGLTPEQYDAMYAEQDGRCKVCDHKRKLNVDHDHDTGAIRGLLCHGCNVSEGLLDGDPARMRALALYVERHGKPCS